MRNFEKFVELGAAKIADHATGYDMTLKKNVAEINGLIETIFEDMTAEEREGANDRKNTRHLHNQRSGRNSRKK